MHKDYEVPAVVHKREQLQKQINKNPVKVNRDEFKKNDSEKSKLKNLKKAFERNMRKRFPGFNKRKWAQSSYRNEHPQIKIK